MKKTYIAPNMECITVAATNFLCGSLSGDGLQMNINNSAATGEAEGRSFDLDDED